MSIVRASLSTAFDTTTAPETGTAAAGYPVYVEGGSATSVTTGGSANTKGSWVEAIASTSGDADLIQVTVAGLGSNGINSGTLLDIGTGAAAAEAVLVPDIACGGAPNLNTNGSWTIAIPMAVASGTRIALRAAGAQAADSFTVYLSLFNGAQTTGTTAVALGANTGASSGTAVGTSWTEIVASTAATYNALVICPSLATTSATTSADDLIIGTGAAAAEVEIGRVPVNTDTFETIRPSNFTFAWQLGAILTGVPSGTRIVAKRAVACDVSFIAIN